MEPKRGSLFGIPLDLAAVTLALFTWGIGEGMFLYIQPLYLQSFGARPVEIGAILSMVGVAMALAQIPAGAISDRIGALPVLRSAWTIGLISATSMALAGSLPVFVAGMVMYGVTSYVSAPLSSYQSQARGHWSVERALTIPGAVYNLGTFIGAITGGWVGGQWGLQTIYRVAAVLFVFSNFFIYRARSHQEAAPVEHHAVKHPGLAANPRFLGLLGVIVFSLFALYLPQPLTPVYLSNQQNFSVQEIGWIGAVASLSNAIILMTLGSLLRAQVGLIAGLLLVGTFVVLMWQGSRPWMFYLGYFFLGGYRIYRAMAIARVRAAVRVNQTGLAFGMVETGNAVAVILAPLAAGLLYDQNPQSVYVVSLAAIGIALAFNLLQISNGSRMAPEAVISQPVRIDIEEREEPHGS